MQNLHLALSYVVLVKSKAKILQNFVAFSEYMNFTTVGAVQLSQEKRIVINNLPLLISQLLKYHECHVNNFYGVYYIADLACPDMLSCVAMVTTRTFFDARYFVIRYDILYYLNKTIPIHNGRSLY